MFPIYITRVTVVIDWSHCYDKYWFIPLALLLFKTLWLLPLPFLLQKLILLLKGVHLGRSHIFLFTWFGTILYTMEPLWRGQECLTKVAKFDPYSGTILYKSCFFTPHDRPPLLKGHHFRWPLWRGFTVFVKYCVCWWTGALIRVFFLTWPASINVSLKLRNLIHIQAPFFTNHVYFTPHDRPPLLKGHHFRWPLWRGFTVFNKYCVCWWTGNLISFFFLTWPASIIYCCFACICVCVFVKGTDTKCKAWWEIRGPQAAAERTRDSWKRTDRGGEVEILEMLALNVRGPSSRFN